MNRKKYHVTPSKDGGWEGKVEGADRASLKGPTKEEVVEKTKELAKKAPLGQVIIHDRQGRIQTEHTYGKDPNPPKG